MSGLEECQRVTDPADIPCDLISSWSPADCSIYTVEFYNESGDFLRNATIGVLGSSGRCNITFNYTEWGLYHINATGLDTWNVNVRGDKMWLVAILLIPLGLAFFFIYWGNTLQEEHEPMKWFMRLLSIVMLFVLFVSANIVIELNPGFEALQDVFNIAWIQWIFYAVFALFLVYFIYRIALAMREKQQDEFEQGLIR